MKSDHFITALVLGLFLTTAATCALSFQYVQGVRKLQRLQFEKAQVSVNMSVFNALLNEAIEYSKRNPAIDPLLQSAGLKQKTGAPAPTPTPKTAK